MYTIGVIAGLDGDVVDGIVRVDAGSAGWSRPLFAISRLSWGQPDLEELIELRNVIIHHQQIQNLKNPGVIYYNYIL